MLNSTSLNPLTIETVKDKKLKNIPSHMHSQQMNPSLSMKLRKGGKDMGETDKTKVWEHDDTLRRSSPLLQDMFILALTLSENIQPY